MSVTLSFGSGEGQVQVATRGRMAKWLTAHPEGRLETQNTSLSSVAGSRRTPPP